MQDILMWGLNGVLGMFVTVLWSIFNDLKKNHEELEDEFHKYRTDSARELADYKTDSAARFLTRDEMEKMVGSIKQTLDRHADKMDNRLDRLEERLLETRRP